MNMGKRPLAVSLVAAYLWFKAMILALCFVASYFRPETQPAMNGVIETLVPVIWGLRKLHADMWLGLLVALIDGSLGIGFWFLQKWAWTVVVLDLTYTLGRGLIGLIAALALYRDEVHLHRISPLFTINILVSVIMLGTLLDPDVKRAFGKRA
jgi:hypothetical protein